MNQLPILFKAPMVLAILNGTKTQTRRIVKWRDVQPGLNLGFSGLRVSQTPEGWVLESATRTSSEWRCKPTPCPHGLPGDELWVRETWRTAKSLDDLSPSAIADRCQDAGYRLPWAPLAYEADGHRNSYWKGFEFNGDAQPGKTRVSIHMPQWASRITLRLTSVRVERLHAISQADALAEGITTVRTPEWDLKHFDAWRKEFDEACQAGIKPPLGPSPCATYHALWEEINGPGSWDLNPWVWVEEFTRVK
jgi:hypothetical protein